MTDITERQPSLQVSCQSRTGTTCSRASLLQRLVWTESWINQWNFVFQERVWEKSINFANDTEDHQRTERISPELVNGYRPEYADWSQVFAFFSMPESLACNIGEWFFLVLVVPNLPFCICIVHIYEQFRHIRLPQRASSTSPSVSICLSFVCVADVSIYSRTQKTWLANHQSGLSCILIVSFLLART